MYGPVQILADMLPGPAEGSSSQAPSLGTGAGLVDHRSTQESGPGRQEQGAGGRMDASDGNRQLVSESEDSEGVEVGNEGLGRELEELKEYKRQHDEMLHVSPSHSECVDRAMRSLAGVSTAFGNPHVRL
jgi:hypothetical protein